MGPHFTNADSWTLGITSLTTAIFMLEEQDATICDLCEMKMADNHCCNKVKDKKMSALCNKELGKPMSCEAEAKRAQGRGGGCDQRPSNSGAAVMPQLLRACVPQVPALERSQLDPQPPQETDLPVHRGSPEQGSDAGSGAGIWKTAGEEQGHSGVKVWAQEGQCGDGVFPSRVKIQRINEPERTSSR